MQISAIVEWHRIVAHRHVCGFDAILDVDAVVTQRVVHLPQAGKALTRPYLTAAFSVLGNNSFRYVREVVGERDAALEFVAEVEGIHVNGVDMIRWNDEGKLVDFKVVLRPLKGGEPHPSDQKTMAILPALPKPAWRKARARGSCRLRVSSARRGAERVER